MKMTKSEKCQFYPYLGGWKDKQGATDMSNPHPAVPRPKNNQIQPFVSKIGCCEGQGDAVKIEKEKGNFKWKVSNKKKINKWKETREQIMHFSRNTAETYTWRESF